MKIPTDLERVRAFFQAVNWGRLEAEVAGETRARLAIVGAVNSGKSTLFNKLKGKAISAVTAVPGTTKTAIVESFGPFTLVDTPGFDEVVTPPAENAADGSERQRLAQAEIARASVVVLLFDASAGVRQSDLNLYHSICAQGIPVIAALNKIDLVRRDLDAILHDLARRLHGLQVIPISARTGAGLAERLIPAIIQAAPEAAIVIGRALPEYRAAASRRIINSTTWWALLLGTEPIPGLDMPLLLGMQGRMVLRLAAIYGENFTAHHARELIFTIAGSLGSRYLGMQLAKLIPALGWVISGVVAALSTLALGKTTQAYFASGYKLPSLRSLGAGISRTPQHLQELYRKLLLRPRAEAKLPPPEEENHTADSSSTQTLPANEASYSE